MELKQRAFLKRYVVRNTELGKQIVKEDKKIEK